MLPIITAGLGLLGKLFTGGAKSSQNDRNLANQNLLIQDRNRADAISDHERALMERARVDMEQRELNQKTQESGYKQSMRANYAANYQPAQRPKGIQTIHGSFNTVSPEMREMAKQFEQQAMVRALQGEKFAPQPVMERFAPAKQKEASLWEKMSGALGLGLSGASAASGLFGKGGDEEETHDLGGLL